MVAFRFLGIDTQKLLCQASASRIAELSRDSTTGSAFFFSSTCFISSVFCCAACSKRRPKRAGSEYRPHLHERVVHVVHHVELLRLLLLDLQDALDLQ